MKKRMDYVTNSSSSSFIVSTKNEVPIEYLSDVKKIDNDAIAQTLAEIYSELQWERITYEMEDEELQKLGNFTDEQMWLIKLANTNNLQLYLELKERLNNDEDLYHILIDRDWYYYQTELKRFVDNAELVNEEYDL